MKGLYKKISVGVLASMLVLGGSLSQGVIGYAHSGPERCQDEINKCKDELNEPKKSSGYSLLDEIDKNSNYDRLKYYENIYKYKVLQRSEYDFKPNDADYYLKKYYEDIWHFLDCIVFHLEEHRPKGIRYYNIGGEYFKILFE